MSRNSQYRVTVSASLPVTWAKAMDNIIKSGRFKSRSSFITHAIREQVNRMISGGYKPSGRDHD